MNVPVMYPSGATTTVEIEMNGGNCWVSDMGHGLVEAEYMGAQGFYTKSAKDVAGQHGVQFDGNSIFALWVPVARLESAIVCVANSSCQAAQSAIQSASEQKATKKNDQIFERIQAVFGKNIVSKSADIQGRHAQWDAKNVVIFPDRRKAVFEFMTGNSISVSSKFLMFSDILKANDGVSLNAVVSKANQLNSKGQMIADVANIIEFTATDQEFMQVAKAS
mmetsp:Transcript_27439/g.50593  ORF Transcript_27439/g.50593 Transcript_27439/m.50593 type:complete len:221 (-) Transcript_27439:350-1012(-)